MCIVHRLGMLTFLQDKDIGKYNQALAQALDGISAKAAFIKVCKNCRVYPSIVIHIFTRLKRSTLDVVTWLETWESKQKLNI